MVPALYVFSVRIAHLTFPFLSCHLFGFFCGFPPFNVPMPWCHLLHFGANWLLKAKKKITAPEPNSNQMTPSVSIEDNIDQGCYRNRYKMQPCR
jgi:hypothetical protein